MGRRVYWRVVILVTLYLLQGTPVNKSLRELSRLLQVKRQTIVRWRVYFQLIFPQSREWQYLRGRLSSEVGNDNLPADLLDYFLRHSTDIQQGLIDCLRFLTSGLPP
jgi:hypothetical protein